MTVFVKVMARNSIIKRPLWDFNIDPTSQIQMKLNTFTYSIVLTSSCKLKMQKNIEFKT